MGLLDFLNTEEGRLGLGLLAASGPRADNMGAGGRIQEAFQGQDAYRARQQSVQMHEAELRMKQMQDQRAQQQFKNQQEFYNNWGQQSPSQGGVMSQDAPKNNQLLMLEKAALSGVPGAKELFDIYKYKNEPQKLDQGATYENRVTGKREFMPKIGEGIGPDGSGNYGELPGYGNAQASIEGKKARAIERAKAGLDPFTYTPKGAENPILTNRAAAMGEPGMRAAASGDMGADPMAIQREILATTADLKKPLDPSSRAQLSAHLQDLMRQGENVKSSSGVSLQSPSEAASLLGATKDTAEQRKTIMNGGFSAGTQIAKYTQLGKLLEGVDGGSLTATGTNIASSMNSLGFKIDKNLPNKEAAAALGNEMALELRNPASGAGMPGAMSDKDREFLVSMIPSANQSAAGRKQLITSSIAVEQRKQQMATFARNYEKKYGRLDNGFFDQMQAWSNANPLFGAK